MKIGILICSEASGDHFTGSDRLIEAGEARGHQVKKLFAPRFVFKSGDDGVEIFYEDEPLEGFDVLIYRPSFIEEPGLHSHVIRMLKDAGYGIVNGDANVSATKNKLEQRVIFQDAGFPIPEWAIVKSRKHVAEVTEEIGFPLIVKVAFGTHGIGVFYAENLETLQPIVDYLSIRDGNPMIIEKFISDADRKDVRVFIVGNKIVGAMEREARAGEMRANVAAGGKGTVTELTDDEERLALDVVKRFDLEIAGVDLLRTENGPMLLEVNSNPGFKELETATGNDIAGAIIDFTAEKR